MRHIIIKMSEVDKKKTLKAIGEKQLVPCKGNPIRL